jgi:Flp pilus assembly protein TadD
VIVTASIILLQEERIADATRELQKARALAPDFALTLYYLATALLAEGDFAAAGHALEAAAKDAPGFPGIPGALAYRYHHTGRDAAADSMLADLRQRIAEPRSLANLAFTYAVLGRLDDAFPLLEQLSWDIPSVIELRADPLLRALRRDPRYALLLRRISGP